MGAKRLRLRELGVDLSEHLPAGVLNAITDVAGVRALLAVNL